MGNASSVGCGDTCLPEEMCGSGNTILKYGGIGVNSKDQVIYYFAEEKKAFQENKPTSLLRTEEDAFYTKLPGKIGDYELFMCQPGIIFEPCTKRDLNKYDKNAQKEVKLRIRESKLRHLREQLEDIEQALDECEDEESEKILNHKKNDLEAMIDRAETLKEECDNLGLYTDNCTDKESHQLHEEIIVKKKSRLPGTGTFGREICAKDFKEDKDAFGALTKYFKYTELLGILPEMVREEFKAGILNLDLDSTDDLNCFKTIAKRLTSQETALPRETKELLISNIHENPIGEILGDLLSEHLPEELDHLCLIWSDMEESNDVLLRKMCYNNGVIRKKITIQNLVICKELNLEKFISKFAFEVHTLVFIDCCFKINELQLHNKKKNFKHTFEDAQSKKRCRLREVIFEDCDFENGYKKKRNSLQVIVEALNGVRILTKKLKSITIYESDASISKALAKKFKRDKKVQVNP